MQVARGKMMVEIEEKAAEALRNSWARIPRAHRPARELKKFEQHTFASSNSLVCVAAAPSNPREADPVSILSQQIFMRIRRNTEAM